MKLRVITVGLRSKFAIVSMMLLVARDLLAGHLAGLPPTDAPTPHWPWWLRILAVLGALVFIQIVARAMRRRANRRGPDSGDSE